MLAASWILATPGVMAQSTLTVNGASGSNTVSTAQSTTGGLVINQIFGVEYLLVGGGGGSGGVWGENASGAGGAGGLLHNTGTGAPLALSGNAYAVTVGAGGQGSAGNLSPSASGFAAGGNGANSVFSGTGISTLTAFGGGGGGVGHSSAGAMNNGRNGGSGGAPGGQSGASAGLGTSGQGNAGGGLNGKGGGAGQSGTAGGQGLQVNITGTSTYYAGGGGDGAQSVLGGGGAGSGTQNNAPQNGSPNTGGGGGNAWANNAMSGASGGSGIVVLRYGGLVLPGLATSVTSGSGTVTRTSYTADGTNGVNGQLYQVYSFTIGSSTTSGSFAFDMSAVDLGARLATTLTGTISGTGNLTFNGPGRLTLNAINTYSGSTTVAAGTLALGQAGAVAGSSGISILNGAAFDVSGIGGGFSLGSGQSLGGAGSILGNLTFGAGSQLMFSQTATLALSGGTASFFSGTPGSRFGIDDLIGLTSSTPESTYTLLSGAVDTTNLDNVGASNALNLGGGKSAYFQSGGLQVVVVPEPGALALVGIGIAAAAQALRRLR